MPNTSEALNFAVMRADSTINLNLDTVADAKEAITGLAIAADLGMNILGRYDGHNGPSILAALHQIFDNIQLLLT